MIFARSTAPDPFRGEYGVAIVPLADELRETGLRLAHRKGMPSAFGRTHRMIAQQRAKRELRRILGQAGIAAPEVRMPSRFAEDLVPA